MWAVSAVTTVQCTHRHRRTCAQFRRGYCVLQSRLYTIYTFITIQYIICIRRVPCYRWVRHIRNDRHMATVRWIQSVRGLCLRKAPNECTYIYIVIDTRVDTKCTTCQTKTVELIASVNYIIGIILSSTHVCFTFIIWYFCTPPNMGVEQVFLCMCVIYSR